MGHSAPTPAELKRQVIAELELARADLFFETRQAKIDWNPVTLTKRSIERHKIAWIAGAAVAAFIVVRLVLPPKIRSDKSGDSGRKRGLAVLLGGLLFKAARSAALNYAAKHFKAHAETYLHSKLNRHGPVSPPHVASR